MQRGVALLHSGVIFSSHWGRWVPVSMLFFRPGFLASNSCHSFSFSSMVTKSSRAECHARQLLPQAADQTSYPVSEPAIRAATEIPDPLLAPNPARTFQTLGRDPNPHFELQRRESQGAGQLRVLCLMRVAAVGCAEVLIVWSEWRSPVSARLATESDW